MAKLFFGTGGQGGWQAKVPYWLPWLCVRLAAGIATIWLLSLVVFAATQALPSDPARVILGPEAPESAVSTLRHQLGLDQPLVQQYGRWLRRAVCLDFGRSLDSHAPVTELLGCRLGNTCALLLLAVTPSVLIAVLLGGFMARRRDSRVDRVALIFLIVAKAIPAFAIAIALVALLATSALQLLPAVSLIDPHRSVFAQLNMMVLPAVTLVLSTAPYLVRLVRTSMSEALESEYVLASRLRGIPEHRIVWRHALPNALVPMVQGTALSLGVLLGGTLVVEVTFNFPGLGTALNSAVQSRDLPMIQATVLVITTGVVGLNLLADLLTLLLTPKLRTRIVSLARRRVASREVCGLSGHAVVAAVDKAMEGYS
jgi:peptide/nickel transport system permease protein